MPVGMCCGGRFQFDVGCIWRKEKICASIYAAADVQ